MSKITTRQEEFDTLIAKQGEVTRSMRYGEWKPTEDQKAEIEYRAERLVELAELMGFPESESYVNQCIASWLRDNPLMLGKRRVKFLIDDRSLGDLDSTVGIQIGEPISGYFYRATADDVGVAQGMLIFKVPDSVAEHFRQQGRRQLRREINQLLNP